MNELDSVVLTKELPEHDLTVGDIGTVVHTYEEKGGAEVEFLNAAGKTIAVVTLNRNDIRPMADTEILHARPL